MGEAETWLCLSERTVFKQSTEKGRTRAPPPLLPKNSSQPQSQDFCPALWSILKEINPEHSLEGLMLKLKLQYFGHVMRRTESFEDPDAGKDWRREEKGITEDEVDGWHHRLNGHEFK